MKRAASGVFPVGLRPKSDYIDPDDPSKGKKPKDERTVTLAGLAVPWGTETRLSGNIYERFERGSVTPEAIAREGAFLNLAHDQARAVASVEAGTLRFEDRADGLWMEADIDLRDPDAASLATKVERQDYPNQSIEFAMGGDGYEETREDRDDDTVLYSVKRLGTFYGVAMLTRGAYGTTTTDIVRSAELRSAQEAARVRPSAVADDNLRTRVRITETRLRLASHS